MNRSPHVPFKYVFIACLLLPMSFALLYCGGSSGPVMKVGVGETIINPPIGTPLSGYRRTDVSKGVHDDLHARSLVVEGANGETAVMMTLALVEIGRDFVDSIRAGVNRETGIPADHIMICCTHTHSGPDLGADTSSAYKDLLRERAIESAVTAWKTRVPGRIGIDSTVVYELGRANRRLLYGGLHPDPEVGIIKVEDLKGNLIGVAFNYGCHPSTLDLHNLEFTEDWAHYAIQGIKKKLGEKVWVAYYQGAQGDIKVGYSAELSAVGADMPIRNWWYAELKGNQMTEAVLKALPSVRPMENSEVKTASEMFEYPLMESFPLTPRQAVDELAASERRVAELEKMGEKAGKRTLDRAKVDVFLGGLRLDIAKIAAQPNRPKTMKLEQQAIRIGDAVFVSFPCEVFSEIGLGVKKKSPFPKTFVCALANEPDVGYLPTAEEFLEDSYEVLSSPFSPQAGDVFIDTSLKLIDRVK